jgi:hypothetical protein
MATAECREPTSSDRPPVHRSESPTGYSSAGCSPAEPASASPVSDDSSSIPIRRLADYRELAQQAGAAKTPRLAVVTRRLERDRIAATDPNPLSAVGRSQWKMGEQPAQSVQRAGSAGPTAPSRYIHHDHRHRRHGRCAYPRSRWNTRVYGTCSCPAASWAHPASAPVTNTAASRRRRFIAQCPEPPGVGAYTASTAPMTLFFCGRG